MPEALRARRRPVGKRTTAVLGRRKRRAVTATTTSHRRFFLRELVPYPLPVRAVLPRSPQLEMPLSILVVPGKLCGQV
jgi:hypothetical protein